MITKTLAALGLCAALMLGVAAPANAAAATPSVWRTPSVSYSLGSHLYVHFNRSETREIMYTGTDAAVAAYVAALCFAVVPTSIGGVAACAAGGVVVARAANRISRAAFNDHPNWCITESVKIFPFTDATSAYWVYCSSRSRIF